uniref:Uncharacterized protein n=1 Tax=Phlebotomus papatasi TaxID=29031 RepID=A0A1B0D1N6_PHLPP
MNGMTNSDEVVECPLCMEALEVDDLNFFPCTCGYQICRFCWHRIRTDENELCPACRKAYSENPADFTPLSQEQRVRYEETEAEIEDEVDILMSSDIMAAQMSTKSINFTRAQSGWIFREDRKETIAGQYECDLYCINGLILRRTSLSPPPNCNVTWDEYINAEPGEHPKLARDLVYKESSKTFRATVAMSKDFPLNVEMLLNVLEVIAPFKHFSKLREFVTLKLPSGFPVKIDIPILPTVTAKITFQKFEFRDNIPQSMFEVPETYVEDNMRKSQNMFPYKFDDEVQSTPRKARKDTMEMRKIVICMFVMLLGIVGGVLSEKKYKMKDMMRKSIVFDKMTPDVFYCPTTKPSFEKLIVKSNPIHKLCEFEGRPLPPDYKSDCYQDVTQKDKHGNTPLHLSVMLGRKDPVIVIHKFAEFTQLLLAHGAPVKVKNLQGWSPLAEAISYGDRSTIHLLLWKLKKQARDQMEHRRPNLVKALQQMGDFYMELKWDFQSWGEIYTNSPVSVALVTSLLSDGSDLARLCSIKNNFSFISLKVGYQLDLKTYDKQDSF